VARGLDFRATNPDGSAATARGTVALATASGAAADTAAALRVDSTDVTFANVSTGLVARFAPGTSLPVDGTANGRVAARGTLEALTLDADVALDERRTGRSRVRAAGEVGVDDGVVRARDLRVALEPGAGGAGAAVRPRPRPPRGRHAARRRHGRRQHGERARGARRRPHARRPHRHVAPHRRGDGGARAQRGRRPRATAAERSAAAAVGAGTAGRRSAVATAPSAGGGVVLRRVDASLTLRPVSLATVGRFAPAAGLRGTVSGPVRVRGALDDLAVDARLAFAGPGGRRGGTLDVAGRVGQGRTLRYDLVATPRDLDAGAITTKAPATALTGRIAARGVGTDPATATATLAADLTTLRVDTVGVDSARARLAVGGGVLAVNALAVRAPRATLDARAASASSTAARASCRTGWPSTR
jgi:hypothetical protein